MRKSFRCPQTIFDMFDSPLTIADGRAKVLEWIESQPVEVGDEVIIPHGETGEELILEMENRVQ